MTRPLRLEFSGALYHVTSRGDRREDIFFCDADRVDWLALLTETCARFNWTIHAYCQMTNHYHLLVETPDGNLARGMRELNGIYSQLVNRRHRLEGHLFQGRYKAIVVQKESYLLELARYVVLNPLRAGMVSVPDGWQWSSYRFTTSLAPVPAWLDTDFILTRFGEDRIEAVSRFREFVLAGIGKASPMQGMENPMVLGDSTFLEQFEGMLAPTALREQSKAQRRTVAAPLNTFLERYPDRRVAMAKAFMSGAYTMAVIAQHFGVHPMTVSRAVRAFRMLEC